MMTAAEWSALLVLGFAGSFTPGPNTTLSTTIAANHGLRAAMPFVLGVPAGWGLLLLACSAGLGLLLMEYPQVRLGLMGVGAGYLLWLARRLWGTRALSAVDNQAPVLRFDQGVALQFLNVKAWFLAISVSTGWVIGFGNTEERLWQVFPVFVSFGLTSNLAYALVGASLRHWLQGPDGTARRLQVFNRCMAIALGLTALWVVLSTWPSAQTPA